MRNLEFQSLPFVYALNQAQILCFQAFLKLGALKLVPSKSRGNLRPSYFGYLLIEEVRLGGSYFSIKLDLIDFYPLFSPCCSPT